MQFKITRRVDNVVLHTVNFPNNYAHEPRSVQLGAALEIAANAGANLSHANLEGADIRGADLRGAKLSGAGLSGVILHRANLSGADLQGAILENANLEHASLLKANLKNANLRRASLRCADLEDANLIDAGQDERGYRFVAVPHDDGIRIAAGCRWFTLQEAREHWDGNRRETHAECRARVEMLAQIARLRGWVVAENMEK